MLCICADITLARLCRFSWQTAIKLLEENAVKMEFEADKQDANQPALSFANPGKACTSAVDRHSFFRARRLQSAIAASW
jgi:hypothetical protein